MTSPRAIGVDATTSAEGLFLLVGGCRESWRSGGGVTAVVSTQGCDFRCPYCHHRDLVLPEFYKTPVTETAVLAFLEKRRGKLDGVVVTGGEPTRQPRLPDFLRAVKEMGFRITLETNGIHPKSLKELIRRKLVDYIATVVSGNFTQPVV